jgi:uncharacterized membrane protein
MQAQKRPLPLLLLTTLIILLIAVATYRGYLNSTVSIVLLTLTVVSFSYLKKYSAKKIEGTEESKKTKKTTPKVSRRHK